MSADLQKLLKELEVLSYDQRAKRMYQLGLMAREDNANIKERDAARQLIARLWSGSFYERHMAVISAHGSRNAGLVFEACVNESAWLRRQGLHLASAICDDTQIQKLFEMQNQKQQRDMLKRLRQLRRYNLVDQLVESLRAESMQKYMSAFFFASAEYVEKNLDAIEDRIASEHIARFAYQHPKSAAQFLIQQLEKSEKADSRIMWLVNGALPNLTELSPKSAMEVVSRAVRTMSPARLSYSSLMHIYPNQLLALFDQHNLLSDAIYVPRLDRLTEVSIDRLLSANALRGGTQIKMRRVSSPIAVKIYASTAESWRDQFGCLSTAFVDRLPESVRVKEARRHLANPLIEAKEYLRLSFARYLSYDEALPLVRPLIEGPDVDMRSVGFTSLIPCIRFHRQERSNLLALLLKRKNEPDPVRLSIWSQLQMLPPSIWTGEDVQSLDALIKSSLAASDLSQQTIASIAHFLYRVFPFHTSWAGEWLGKLCRERGSVTARMQLPLTTQQLSDLGRYLKPAVKYWLEREETLYLTSTASLFGKRVFNFPELITALSELAMRAKNEASAMNALMSLKSWAYPAFTELVPQLLKRDKSWATQPVIYGYLHRKRQDLLTPYLGQLNHKGAFHRGNTRLVPAFSSGFHSWTREQQKTYEKNLLQMALETSGAVSNRMFGVSHLVRMPEPPMDALSKLASTTSEDQADCAVRDAVLSNLGNLDAGQGIPLLIEALNDSRARIAIYALKNLPKTMPPDRAMTLLSQIRAGQVTVRKEVFRLIGELKTKDAFQHLLENWETEQHKDVRTAIVRAMWNYVDDDRAWQIFDEAAHASDAGMIETALRIPPERLDGRGRARLLSLYAKAMSAATVRTRCNAISWATYLPIVDEQQVLLGPLLNSILSDVGDESRVAAYCALRFYAQRQPEIMGTLVEKIRQNKRALLQLLSALDGSMRGQRQQLMPAGRAVEAELARDPLLIGRRLAVAGLVLDWPEFGATLKQLHAGGMLHADAIAAAGAAFRSIAHRIDEHSLSELEDDLSKSESETMRRLGLYALTALAECTRGGWSQERLDKLLVYRKDPANLVAAAAEFTLPANELQVVAG